MTKFLIVGNYKPEGVRGLLKDGGSKRRAVVEKAVVGLGGTLEAFYYALGDDDLFAIVEYPDNVSAAAASLAVNASGAVSAKLVALMTAEEIDEATKKVVAYTAPGQ